MYRNLALLLALFVGSTNCSAQILPDPFIGGIESLLPDASCSVTSCTLDLIPRIGAPIWDIQADASYSATVSQSAPNPWSFPYSLEVYSGAIVLYHSSSGTVPVSIGATTTWNSDSNGASTITTGEWFSHAKVQGFENAPGSGFTEQDVKAAEASND